MSDETIIEDTHIYPEEWLRSKEEAKEMEEIDQDMRLKIKKVLQETKK